MSFQQQMIRSWESRCEAAGVTIPARNGRNGQQYMLDLVELLVASAGGPTLDSTGHWNNRYAEACEAYAVATGGTLRGGTVSWNDRVLNAIGSAGAGAPGPLTEVLTAAHMSGATLHVNSDTIKSYSVGAGGELTFVFKTVAAKEDGLREAGGYSLDVTDIFPTYDPTLHLLEAFIDSPVMDADCGIAIALCSNPGTGAVGVGGYAAEANTVSSQGSTSTGSGGGSSPTDWARFVFTPANLGHATLLTFEVQIYKADATVTYGSPGSNYLTSLVGSGVTKTGLKLFISALTLAAVSEDDSAIGNVSFRMSTLPVPP